MTYSEPCKYSIRLIKKLKSLDIENKLDYDLINKAIYWAKKYHHGQFRKSGEPFYTHPLEVAYMISEHNLTTNVIVTSILHDIVEDTVVTAGMILDNFGWRIAEMVDMLTRDRPDGTKLSVEQILNNAYEKNDREVLLVKLVDRVHNVQTLASIKKEKQLKIIQETLDNMFTACAAANYNLNQEFYSAIRKIVSHKENTVLDNYCCQLSFVNQGNILSPLAFENAV